MQTMRAPKSNLTASESRSESQVKGKLKRVVFL